MIWTDETIHWRWQGAEIRVGLTRHGAGPLVLMLPALSSISTRHEMRPLQERLGEGFSTVSVDWPGFGGGERPALRWTPEALETFLRHFIGQIGKPLATVAAGHAAGYALRVVAKAPGSAGKLCLIAPTWRGPLPTMMNGRRAWFKTLARAVDFPLLGSALYRLNVNRIMIGVMARGHVYSDPEFLGGERMAQKSAVLRARGARHASIRFVAGELDPFATPAEFLESASRVAARSLLIYGAETPPKSKAEMEALSQQDHVEAHIIPRGKLSLHEEFPDEVAPHIRSFIG